MSFAAGVQLARHQAHQRLLKELSAGKHQTTYLDFDRLIPKPEIKTEIWLVCSRHHGNILGQIRWHGPWRQYTFWPAVDTLFNPVCLEEIAEVVRGLMELRREN